MLVRGHLSRAKLPKQPVSHDRHRRHPTPRVSEGLRVHSVPLDILYAQQPTTTLLHPGFDFDSTHHYSLDAPALVDSPPVTTRRATPPRRLAPYPFLHKFITFRRVSSACFHRLQANVDRIERILGSRIFYVAFTIVDRIERISGLPSSSVSPGCSELKLPLGTHACT